jgi:teichuronic acid biosynthesis glycosyltransferase TuaC
MAAAVASLEARCSPSSRPGPADTLRLLTFSTLYPNNVRPNHGIFVENRLRHLVGDGKACRSTVIAPVSWCPAMPRRHGDRAPHAATHAFELQHGIPVYHPRYLAVRGLNMYSAPYLLYHSSRPAIRDLLARGERFDAIDAHYVYPDGVAAIWLGRHFNLPVVITARGSDVSLLPDYALPRHLIRRAIRTSAALIAVSAAVKMALVQLGAPDEKVTILRNGVDTRLFRPMDRAIARETLALTRRTLVSVGSLIERKGHDRIIQAMTQLDGCELLIAGVGPEHHRLSRLIDKLNLTDRIRLLGSWPHGDLPRLYNAADALVLASSREGWPNVLMEAIACGTPVVASNIWGNPEIVSCKQAGVLIEQNTSDGIAAAVRRLFGNLPDRSLTRAYAETLSWDDTTSGQLRLFAGLRDHRRDDVQARVRRLHAPMLT